MYQKLGFIKRQRLSNSSGKPTTLTEPLWSQPCMSLRKCMCILLKPCAFYFYEYILANGRDVELGYTYTQEDALTVS